MFSISRFNLSATCCFLLFLIASMAYYFYFTAEITPGSRVFTGYLQYPLNTHDHYVYARYIEDYRSQGLGVELKNNSGIAFLYHYISVPLSFLGVEDWKATALIVNSAVIFMAFVYYVKIHNLLGIPRYWALLFFLNTPLLYFAQLINKDSFTILAFLLVSYFAMSRRYYAIIILLPIFLLIRIQLAIFVIIFLFCVIGRGFGLKVLFAYVLTAVAGGLIAKYELVIAYESMPPGFSRFVYEINKSYLVGSLFLNPVRATQFVQAIIESFSFTLDSGVDVSKILNVPQVIVLLVLLPNILGAIFRVSTYRTHAGKVLLGVVFVYTFVWLMNPTINDRYVFLITPVLVLLALHRKQRRVYNARENNLHGSLQVS